MPFACVEGQRQIPFASGEGQQQILFAVLDGQRQIPFGDEKQEKAKARSRAYFVCAGDYPWVVVYESL
jgi:hypothetical protein